MKFLASRRLNTARLMVSEFAGFSGADLLAGPQGLSQERIINSVPCRSISVSQREDRRRQTNPLEGQRLLRVKWRYIVYERIKIFVYLHVNK